MARDKWTNKSVIKIGQTKLTTSVAKNINTHSIFQLCQNSILTLQQLKLRNVISLSCPSACPQLSTQKVAGLHISFRYWKDLGNTKTHISSIYAFVNISASSNYEGDLGIVRKVSTKLYQQHIDNPFWTLTAKAGGAQYHDQAPLHIYIYGLTHHQIKALNI